MDSFIATFWTHFGAMQFYKTCKKNGVKAKQMPVPRKLSASCGTCVKFEGTSDFAFDNAGEDLEACYKETSNDEWSKIDG